MPSRKSWRVWLWAAFSSAAGNPAVLQLGLSVARHFARAPVFGLAPFHGRRRGNGRGGRHSRSIALPPAARRNATGKASVIGNGSNTGKQQSRRQLARARG